ncbi:hypothetical protein JXM67_14545 [candidate division WOR-3 bacterium]|nr:hypothetical protein [candidate division WOR-3 bacterium]
MGNDFFYDEKANLVDMRVNGKLTEEDITEMSEGKHRYRADYHFLLDIREVTSMLDRKTRHKFKRETDANPPEWTAIIETNPNVRAVENLILKLSGDFKNTRFFEDDERIQGLAERR